MPALRVRPSIFEPRYRPCPSHCKRYRVSESGTQYAKCGQILSGLTNFECLYMILAPHCKRHRVSESGTQYAKCGQILSGQTNFECLYMILNWIAPHCKRHRVSESRTQYAEYSQILSGQTNFEFFSTPITPHCKIQGVSMSPNMTQFHTIYIVCNV